MPLELRPRWTDPKPLGIAAALCLFAAACQCGEPPTVAGLKNRGEPCAQDDECRTALCDTVRGSPKVCQQPCDLGCDQTTEICDSLGVGPTGPRLACLPDLGGLCTACADRSACPYPGDACLAIEGAGFCGRDCSFDGKCPAGWTCSDSAELGGSTVSRQCVPVTGACSCTVASAGQTRECVNQNAFGTCRGVATCDPVHGWQCGALVPRQELCNLADDNCDGNVDEPLGEGGNPLAGIPTKTCGLGPCIRTVAGCADGVEVECVPGTSEPELCDGVDNDCNGTPDDAQAFADLGGPCTRGDGICAAEGVFVCSRDKTALSCNAIPTAPEPESCNGLDDDCDGTVDDVTRPCTLSNSFGTCAGIETCVDQQFTGCTAKAPAAETCNLQDDNCDGRIDEDLTLSPSGGIAPISCGLGPCRQTVPGCINGSVPTCTPLPSSQELCDGIDNDCDGEPDDGYDVGGECTRGQGICLATGTWVCLPDKIGRDCNAALLPPATETCNNLDDDCDGTVDNLGSTSCGLGSCVTSVPRCIAGVPQTCTPDLSKATADLPDDQFLDTNCDGIDGDASKAVFVNCASGTNTAPGTKEQPVKTITHALTLAAAGTRDQILVTGNCIESIVLKAGVGIYGGYDPLWWRSDVLTPLTQATPGGATVRGTDITQPTTIDRLRIVAINGQASSESSIAVHLENSSAVVLSRCDIRAGSGARGADGATGDTGAGGGSGGPGQGGFSAGSSGGGGGSAGTGTCGTGGLGGKGGYDHIDFGGEAALKGGAGSGGAIGGDGGAGGYCSQGDSACGPRFGTKGGLGGTGGTGATGSSGTGGNGTGSIAGGLISASRGTDGGGGTGGGSGAGGGGGGGASGTRCWDAVFTCACLSGDLGCRSDRGGGGGGGGGAGCGGGGGKGGAGGGASIGILLVSSSPTIRDCQIATGNGGDGGYGGRGGSGGTGGPGGTGGSSADDAAGGGDGGKGGDGGAGGPGGGGGGGPSVGIYRQASTPSLSNVLYTIGRGGRGGIGGGSSNGGTDGIAQQVYP